MSENESAQTDAPGQEVLSARFKSIMAMGASEILDCISAQTDPSIPQANQTTETNDTRNNGPHTCTQSCFKTFDGWKMSVQGKRLCKAGNYRAGVLLLEAALQAGATNNPTKIAMYDLMGVAYFNLKEYKKAWCCHSLELTTAKIMKDLPAVLRAMSNVGNTLKMLGLFPQAISYHKSELALSRHMKNKMGEVRALYNVSNAYRALAMHTQKNLINLNKIDSKSLN